jgi:hypothetical protein
METEHFSKEFESFCKGEFYLVCQEKVDLCLVYKWFFENFFKKGLSYTFSLILASLCENEELGEFFIDLNWNQNLTDLFNTKFYEKLDFMLCENINAKKLKEICG